MMPSRSLPLQIFFLSWCVGLEMFDSNSLR